MSELTIPPEADEERATKLVEEHVEVGDVVEIRSQEWADSEQGFDIEGTVTSIEPGYLELDERSPGEGSVRYDEIHTVTKVDTK